VRAHANVSSRLHDPAIVAFLRFGYNDDATTTSFSDVRRLAPAHSLTVRDSARAIVPRRYWSFPVPEPLRLTNDGEYIERFREVLNASVGDRLRGDRAAIMLSGGLDSTSLAATARRAAPDVALRAWTLDGGTPADTSEVRLAASVAARLCLTQEIVQYGGVPFAHLMESGFRTPEPLDEPDWGPWMRVLQRVSRDAPALIVGEDGDALFRPPGLLTMLHAWPAHDVLRRALSYIARHRRKPHLGLWLRRRLAAPFTQNPGYDPRWLRQEFVVHDRARAPSSAAMHATRPEAVSYLGDPYWQRLLESAQPEYTGVPLEIVWPLLDTRVIEFVFSIPPLPWCQDKALMRDAFRDELPAAVITRPKSPDRGRFERQVAEWRASACASTVTLSDAVCHFVDCSIALATLRSGRVTDAGVAWRVLVLDQWLRQLGRPFGASEVAAGRVRA
jgi:asparagine synthase (glutamine-hydrolysing)